MGTRDMNLSMKEVFCSNMEGIKGWTFYTEQLL